MGQDTTYALAWGETTVAGQDTRGPYQVSDHFISAASESLWVDDRLQVVEEDYKINYAAGEVIFSRPIPNGSMIRARFRQVPVHLNRIYRRRQIVLTDEEAGVRAKETKPTPPSPGLWRLEEPAEPLNVAGSKTFSIRVGTDRDLSLEQSLQLNISGQIARDVEVLAILSDQNIPIQPEGNTQTLRELDKVLMQVRGDRLSAILGDYELSFEDSEFGRYQRKLQGALGEATYPGVQISAGGALSEGEFHTFQIVPVEGNQGPYQLTARDGDENIVVLAGTERVWINGERQVRGANNDYTIEYGNGQITFTPRRLITSELRIVVDYEYTNRKYRRTLAAGRSRINVWNGKLRLDATAIREADDAADPIDMLLSEQDNAVIRQAGDDPNAAWVSGARDAQVDESGVQRGQYDLRTLDGVSFYEADSLGRGSYDVSFSWIGPGNGDYIYVGGGIYKYAGPGKGEYAPRIPLPLPVAQYLTAIDLGVDVPRRLKLTGAAAVSDRDENLRSSKDDGDNRGYAYKLSAHYRSDPVTVLRRDLGALDLTACVRDVGERFRPFGRIEGIEDSRRWGLPLTGRRSGEQVREASLGYAPSALSSIQIEYGELRTGAAFRATRRALRAALQPRKEGDPTSRTGALLPNIRYAGEQVRSEGSSSGGGSSTPQRITRHRGDLDLMLWKMQPAASYESEESVRTTGTGQAGVGSYTWSGGASTMGLGDLAFSYHYTMRRDDRLASTRSDSLVSHTQQCRIALRRWEAFSLSGEYTYRKRRNVRSPAQNSSNHLAELNARYAPFQGAVSGELHYKVAHTRVAQESDHYIEVGQGRGNYRREERDGEYEFVPDWDGSYILYTEAFGALQEVSDIAAGGRLAFEPAKFRGRARVPQEGGDQSPWLKALRALSTDTAVDVEQKTGEAGIERRRSAITQDLHLFQRQREGALRLRFHESHTTNEGLPGAQYELVDQSRSARAGLRVGRKWHTELSYEYGTKSRQDETLLAYDIVLQRVTSRLAYALLREAQATVDLVWGNDRDREPVETVSARLLSVKPEIVRSLKAQGRMRVQGEWSRVKASPIGARLVYEMADGRAAGNGFRWDVQFDYRLGRYVTALLSYTGRKEPQRQTAHLGRAEMRAYF